MIFKRLFIKGIKEREQEAVKTWTVMWHSRYDEYASGTKKEFEVFVSEEAANDFANDLRTAFKLIKHTSGNEVRVTANQ